MEGFPVFCITFCTTKIWQMIQYWAWTTCIIVRERRMEYFIQSSHSKLRCQLAVRFLLRFAVDILIVLNIIYDSHQYDPLFTHVSHAMRSRAILQALLCAVYWNQPCVSAAGFVGRRCDSTSWMHSLSNYMKSRRVCGISIVIPRFPVCKMVWVDLHTPCNRSSVFAKGGGARADLLCWALNSVYAGPSTVFILGHQQFLCCALNIVYAGSSTVFILGPQQCLCRVLNSVYSGPSTVFILAPLDPWGKLS